MITAAFETTTISCKKWWLMDHKPWHVSAETLFLMLVVDELTSLAEKMQVMPRQVPLHTTKTETSFRPCFHACRYTLTDLGCFGERTSGNYFSEACLWV